MRRVGGARLTPHLYRDLAYVFVVAVAGGVVARWLRQPTILGYVVGGILIGPFTPGPTLADVHSLELLAEIGVILLMYSIGIEFSVDDLKEVRWVALGGGTAGVLVSIAMGILVAILAGWPLSQGAAIGAIISVASTMVLSRLLIDRNALRTSHGKVMIGITLVEDLAVVLLTILLPAFNTMSSERFLDLGILLGKALLVLIPVIFLSTKLVPRILGRLASSGNDELFVLIAVAIGFATAAITQAVGLSLALGAFLAGVVISGSEYCHQTLSRLLPIRDVFVALFFVTVGALINPRALIANPLLLATIVAMVIVGKFASWTLIVRLFRYQWRTAILVGVGLTQIGEFSYVLVQVARAAKIVSGEVYNATLAASLITIIFNALLVRFVSNRLAPAAGFRNSDS